MHGRSLRLHHKTVDKLLRQKKEAEQESVYRVARRIHAVVLNHEGRSSGEIAALLKVHRSRVSEWLRSYEEHGCEGLLEGHRVGRSARLNDEQKAQLSELIESGSIAYGYLSGVWTSVMIAQVIRNEFQVSYEPRHVRRILDQLGFSLQRPKRILAKADPKKQDRWRRYTYPNIKKKRVQKMRR